MRLLVHVAFGTVALLATAAAQAQMSLTQVQGTALVNRGTGFVRVTQPRQLSPGDRVAVNQGNRARVRYPDGCEAEVVPGAVLIVSEVSPCASAAAVQPPPQPDLPIAGVVLLGAGAAAIGLAIAASGDEDRFPFTPPPRSP